MTPSRPPAAARLDRARLLRARALPCRTLLSRTLLPHTLLVRALLVVASAAGPAAAQDPGADGRLRRAAALGALVEAERAFSATAERLGGRVAFLTHMDSAVVQFVPAPAVGLEALGEAADFPTPFTWAPEAAEVSAAGDLGYTTGPVRSVGEDGEPRYSQYFSLWRREEPWAFRVTLDVGSARPGEVAWPPRTVRSDGPPPAGAPGGAGRALTLDAAEAAFQEAYRTAGAASAYRAAGAAALRLHRSPEGPVVGLDDAVRRVEARAEAYGWETLGREVSASDDLGYAWGRARGADGRAFGFVRVWRRDGAGAWRLVAEVVNAPPAGGGS